MKHLSNIAVIGSGPSAIYLLQNIWNQIDILKDHIAKISIFEKEKNSGMGMPYNPNNTDIFNLANISSEEIPLLQITFADWLRSQDKVKLKKLNIHELPIEDSKVYSRIALGHYFQNQFEALLTQLKSVGIEVVQHCESEIVDISKSGKSGYTITNTHHKHFICSTVIIATGHGWLEKDQPKKGYYASPWPIHKILPKQNEFYDFPIGTLGASLSAFDVVTSLSHRHGKFVRTDDTLKFIKHKDAPNFKIILHAAEGWLPHLQYEQAEPIREIYRHFDRIQLLELIDENGFLNIEDYFDSLCRPALISAFKKDKLHDVVKKLENKSFSFKILVAFMADKHEYVNSFKGMKAEMITAKDSVENNKPIHWMETLDDLMYSLNYHAELLPAEDHLFFHKDIMSFLMNVIAALPLQSAEILLALYDAGSIDIKAGYVTIEDGDQHETTNITIKLPDETEEKGAYRLFVNCGGDKKLELKNYPFQSLVKNGTIQSATAKFVNPKDESIKNLDENDIIKESDDTILKLSGIEIDSAYRTIDKNGKTNSSLYDINFTHVSGLRPYSYGLQACNATSMIVVESWNAEILEDKNVGAKIEDITELYEDIDEL